MFERPGPVGGSGVPLRLQGSARLFEIVVVDRKFAGAKAACRHPVIQVFLVALAVAADGNERNGAVADDRAVGRLGVGQDHGVLAVLVFEEIRDPVFFHQAPAEIVVRLAVLDAVVDRIVALGEIFPVVGKIMLAENLGNDLRSGLVLEDAAIGVFRQEPEPGPQREPVDVIGVTVAEPPGVRQQAVEMAGIAVVGDHLDRHVRGDRLVEIQVFLLADDLDADLEIIAQAFVALDGDDGKLILAKDRRQFGHSLFLSELSYGHESSPRKYCGS